MAKKKSEKPKGIAKYPIPVPFELKSTEDHEFLPRIVPIPLVTEGQFQHAFEGIGFKKDRREIPHMIMESTKGQIPQNAQYQQGGIFAIYEPPSKPTPLEFSEKVSPYITPEGLTEEGKKIVDENVKTMINDLEVDLTEEKQKKNIVVELLNESKAIPKGKKASDCFTKIRIDKVPSFVFDVINPPVRNRYNKSVYCANGMTYGFLKKLSKSGVSTKRIGSYSSKTPYNNPEAIMNKVDKAIKQSEYRLEGIQKVFHHPDQIAQKNKEVIENVKKIYGNTQQYVYLDDCGTHKEELYPIDELPEDVEFRQVVMDERLAIKNGDICKKSDVYIHRDGQWGEMPYNTMLGYRSEVITDPEVLAKLSKAKKITKSK